MIPQQANKMVFFWYKRMPIQIARSWKSLVEKGVGTWFVVGRLMMGDPFWRGGVCGQKKRDRPFPTHWRTRRGRPGGSNLSRRRRLAGDAENGQPDRFALGMWICALPHSRGSWSAALYCIGNNIHRNPPFWLRTFGKHMEVRQLHMCVEYWTHSTYPWGVIVYAQNPCGLMVGYKIDYY